MQLLQNAVETWKEIEMAYVTKIYTVIMHWSSNLP